MTMSRRRVWAPVALAVAVVAVIVGVTVAVRGGGGTTSKHPALLRLAGDGVPARSAGATAGADSAVRPGGSAYVIDGALPTGQPADQAVWRVTAPDADAAQRVARALGLDGTPTSVEGGWVLRASHDLRLAVRDDGSWSYGLDCLADQPVEDEKLDVMCASGTGVAVAPPAPDSPDASAGAADDAAPTPPPGPAAADARTLATPILRALGVVDARISVSEGTPTTTVQASYDVDGMTTVGLTTTLSFTGDSRLATGDGWLTELTKGDSYPVITAPRAFELLREQPRPMIEMCMRRSDGKPGCADIPPTVITGATLGLTMAQDAGRPTLVPRCLFPGKDKEEPLSQVAVEPSYLAAPATATDTPMSVPPDGGKGGGANGTQPGGSSPGYPGPADTKPVVTPEGESPA